MGTGRNGSDRRGVEIGVRTPLRGREPAGATFTLGRCEDQQCHRDRHHAEDHAGDDVAHEVHAAVHARQADDDRHHRHARAHARVQPRFFCAFDEQGAVGLEPSDALVVKEANATYAATPEEQPRRPKTKTAIANLFLAGDWIDTGLPATLESAVLSGERAAAAAIDFLAAA